MSGKTATEPKPLLDRQTEAEDYLKAHKINELFGNITAHLVFSKPGEFRHHQIGLSVNKLA